MSLPKSGVRQRGGGIKTAKARRGERRADGRDLSKPATGRTQAGRDRQDGGIGENVSGEFGLLTDEGQGGGREKARPQGSEN